VTKKLVDPLKVKGGIAKKSAPGRVISPPSAFMGQPRGPPGKRPKASTGKRPSVVARKAGQLKNPPKKKK
jgi:hypothetical protein